MALPLEKVLYSAHTHVTGGRDGSGRSSDGKLDVKLDHFASGKGGGTNPEQLFGVGYSACFLSAIGIAAQSLGVRLPAEASVDADVGLGQVATGEYQRNMFVLKSLSTGRGAASKSSTTKPFAAKT